MGCGTSQINSEASQEKNEEMEKEKPLFTAHDRKTGFQHTVDTTDKNKNEETLNGEQKQLTKHTSNSDAEFKSEIEKLAFGVRFAAKGRQKTLPRLSRTSYQSNESENKSVRPLTARTARRRFPVTSNSFQLLCGNINAKVDLPAKCVKIFLSSTFSDTKHERNALMEKVYPELKDMCHAHGYEFEVVDMRWGVREHAANDHLATELCLREIERCQNLSVGPNFVTLLSHKYGYRPLPRRILETDFLLIVQDMDQSTIQLMNQWYVKDENAQPVEYILQPITSRYPDYLSKDLLKRAVASRQWDEVFVQLHQALVTGVKTNIKDKERASEFITSVTEREIHLGALKSHGPANNVLWFRRDIEGIESAQETRELGRFMDNRGNKETIEEARRLLSVLKKKKVPTATLR